MIKVNHNRIFEPIECEANGNKIHTDTHTNAANY